MRASAPGARCYAGAAPGRVVYFFGCFGFAA